MLQFVIILELQIHERLLDFEMKGKTEIGLKLSTPAEGANYFSSFPRGEIYSLTERLIKQLSDDLANVGCSDL